MYANNVIMLLLELKFYDILGKSPSTESVLDKNKSLRQNTEYTPEVYNIYLDLNVLKI